MEHNEIETPVQNSEIKNSLVDIKLSLVNLIQILTQELNSKNSEIKILKEELENLQNLTDGNRQLINKLLTDIGKLQNDVEWYKKTYVQRSFFGTIREKIFRRSEK